MEFNNGQTSVSLYNFCSSHYGSVIVLVFVFLQSSCGLEGSTSTTLVCLAPPLTQLNNYTVVMDAAPGPDTNGELQLQLVLDPNVTDIALGTRMVEVGRNNSVIRISVSGQQQH